MKEELLGEAVEEVPEKCVACGLSVEPCESAKWLLKQGNTIRRIVICQRTAALRLRPAEQRKCCAACDMSFCY